MPLQRNLLVFLSGCSALLGSTFIVAKNGDEIVVGADSRVTLTIDYTKTRQGPDTCKIHKCATRRYFVVASNQFINIKTGVDFSELANQSCKASGDPKANADSFETKAVAAAGRILKEDKQTTVLVSQVSYCPKKRLYRSRPLLIDAILSPKFHYRSRFRVRAAFCAALLSPAFPFVWTAFWAARLRLAALRLRALAWAWRERAKCEAACLPSR